MAISYIGQATGITSATLPTHQTGDLLLAFAYRDGSTTAPTVPTGWTTISSGTGGGGSSNSSALAYRVATASGTASGTWTNATGVVFHVYRGVSPSAPIGIDGTQNGSTTSVTYPAVTLTNTTGTSWVAGFAGHRSVDTNLQNAPTGMTNRSNYVDTVNELAGHDTNAGVSSWSAQSVAVGGTASNWITRVVEIIAAQTYDGTATLAGSGTLAATATNTKDTSASLAGSGAFAVSATTSSFSGYPKRILEDGNYRVTEDVLYRIQETGGTVVLNGDASLSGAGSISIAALITRYGAASLNGSGSLSSTALLIYNGSSALSGSGSLSASGKIQFNASASILGAGSLSSTALLTKNASVSLQGTGTLSANGSRFINAASSITGAGSLQGTAIIVIPIQASLSASGTISYPDVHYPRRITEDGKYRFSESSLYRTIETLYYPITLTLRGKANLVGLGNVNIDSLVFQVGKIYAKSGNRWLEITPYVYAGDSWKIADQVFVKNNGIWKQVYINGN